MIDWVNFIEKWLISLRIDWPNVIVGAFLALLFTSALPRLAVILRNALHDRYKTYYGKYYTYNWAVAGRTEISEKILHISRSLMKGSPNVEMHIQENVQLAYYGRLRANHKSLYFDLIGKGHPEYLKIICHEPLDQKINLLTSVFAATTLDCDPLCGKLVISSTRLNYEKAKKMLGARNLIIIDSKHQKNKAECSTSTSFINSNIT